MAESEGFEPPVPVKAQRFSKPSRSATPATLRDKFKLLLRDDIYQIIRLGASSFKHLMEKN